MLDKKTLLALILSLTFLFTAAACGGPEPVEPSLSGDAQPAQTGPDSGPSSLPAPDSGPSQNVPAVEPSALPAAPETPAPDVSGDGAPGVEQDFLSLSDAALMEFILEYADGAQSEGAQHELGERLLARPADVLAALAEYDGYTIQRWTEDRDGAQFLADFLAREFAVMRGGADDAALQTALDGQSGAMAQLVRDAVNAYGPAGTAQKIYDQLAGADQITVTLVADEGGGTWTGSPADFNLPCFVGDWEWTVSDGGTASGSAVSAVAWTLTISAGETSIQFYSDSTAAACTVDGTLSVLYAVPLCPDNLGELLYARAVELPLG